MLKLKIRKHVALMAFMAICCALPSAKAVESPPRAISLPDAIAKALANNPEIRELQATLQHSGHAIQELKSQRLPRLSLAGQYTTSDDITHQLPDSNQAVALAEESLYQGGRAAADIERLKSLNNSASADLEVKRLEVTLAVQESYFRAIAAEEQGLEWTQAQDEFRHVLKLIEPRFTVGSVPEFDFVKIRLSIAQYEQEALLSHQSLQHEMYTLGALMASDPPDVVQAVSAAPPPPALDLDQLMKNLPGRPDVRSAESLLTAQNFALKRAYRERWPDLKLSGDYGYSGQHPSDVTIGWGFNTTASLPLYDFGTLHSRILQAQSERSAQEYRLEALNLKIRTEMSDALEMVKTAWQSLRVAQESIPQAEKAYQSSLHRYRTGLAAMAELSDAHDLLVQSRLHLSQATADYRIALAQLAAAQGHLPEAEQ